ncbi:MAG TPA: hypothetical protein VNM72_11300 [Blastocatellia bacterium]|nr:hypothetical protein [Blastocatellia bacterium]
MRPRVMLELMTPHPEEALLTMGRIEVVLSNEANKPRVKPILRLMDVPDEVRLLARPTESVASASAQSVIITIDPAGGIEAGNGKILADILPILYGTPLNVVLTLYHLRREGSELATDLLSYRVE